MFQIILFVLLLLYHNINCSGDINKRYFDLKMNPNLNQLCWLNDLNDQIINTIMLNGTSKIDVNNINDGWSCIVKYNDDTLNSIYLPNQHQMQIFFSFSRPLYNQIPIIRHYIDQRNVSIEASLSFSGLTTDPGFTCNVIMIYNGKTEFRYLLNNQRPIYFVLDYGTEFVYYYSCRIPTISLYSSEIIEVRDKIMNRENNSDLQITVNIPFRRFISISFLNYIQIPNSYMICVSYNSTCLKSFRINNEKINKENKFNELKEMKVCSNKPLEDLGYFKDRRKHINVTLDMYYNLEALTNYKLTIYWYNGNELKWNFVYFNTLRYTDTGTIPLSSYFLEQKLIIPRYETEPPTRITSLPKTSYPYFTSVPAIFDSASVSKCIPDINLEEKLDSSEEKYFPYFYTVMRSQLTIPSQIQILQIPYNNSSNIETLFAEQHLTDSQKGTIKFKWSFIYTKKDLKIQIPVILIKIVNASNTKEIFQKYQYVCRTCSQKYIEETRKGNYYEIFDVKEYKHKYEAYTSRFEFETEPLTISHKYKIEIKPLNPVEKFSSVFSTEVLLPYSWWNNNKIGFIGGLVGTIAFISLMVIFFLAFCQDAKPSEEIKMKKINNEYDEDD